MKTRRREPLPTKGYKLASHHIRRLDSCDTSLEEVVAPPPSFSLTGPEFARAAHRAARTGGLTQAEASAITRMVTVIFRPIPPSELFSTFRRVFHDLASATTPDRAEDLALWSPFSPERLREACKWAYSARTRKAG